MKNKTTLFVWKRYLKEPGNLYNDYIYYLKKSNRKIMCYSMINGAARGLTYYDRIEIIEYEK